MSCNMAALTNQRHLPVQQFAVVASMGLMADEAVLLHRRMLPQKRSSLVGVAFVTELIERIRPQHLIRAGSNPCAEATHRFGHKTAHRIVATGTGELLMADKLFIDRMAGLFVRLGTDSLMAFKTEVGLSCNQKLIHTFMNGVAIVASIACLFVLIHVPEGQSL